MTPSPDVTDKDALIAVLMARVEEQRVQIEDLLALNTALTAGVADLEAKLGLPPKTPDNSSLPPSKGQKPSGSTPPQRKAKSHRGAHRELYPNPTRRRDVRATSCRNCGVDVSGVEQSPCETYERVEIPKIEPDMTRVSLHGGYAPAAPSGSRPRRPKVAEANSNRKTDR